VDFCHLITSIVGHDSEAAATESARLPTSDRSHRANHALPFDPAGVSLIVEMAEATLNEAKAQPLPRHLLAKRIRGMHNDALLPALD